MAHEPEPCSSSNYPCGKAAGAGMTSNASRKYAAAMQSLAQDNPEAHRAILARVQSWKTIADKWRRQAEGKPETPSAKQWRKQAEGLRYQVTLLERRLAELEYPTRNEDT